MLQRSALRGALIAAALLLAPLTAQAAGQVGEAAADFSLTDTNGMNRMLSDHSGEVLFLFMVGYG